MVESKGSVYDPSDPPIVHASVARSVVARSEWESLMMAQSLPEAQVVGEEETTTSTLTAGTPGSFPSFRNDNGTVEEEEEEVVMGSYSVKHHADPADADRSWQQSQGEDSCKDRTVGAGVAGGLIGLVFCGPILGLMAGFTAAFYSQREGAAGDTARAMGDVALSVRDKAQEIDERHDVVERSKRAVNDAAGDVVDKARDLNQEYHLVQKVKDWTFIVYGGYCRALEYVTERVEERMARTNETL